MTQELTKLDDGLAISTTEFGLALHCGDTCVCQLPMQFEADGKCVSPDTGQANWTDEEGTLCIEWASEHEVFDELSCFTGAKIHARRWRSFVFNGHNRFWNANDDVTVEVKSCNKVRGEVRSNWYSNVPARVIAFDLEEHGWLAISIPGALSVARTSFSFYQGIFSLQLNEYRPLEEVGPLRVYFRAGLESASDALTFHADLTRQLGYWRNRSDHPAWWSLPRWGMYDENCFAGQTSLNAPDARNSPLTTERVKQWKNQVREITGLDEFCIFYDQGYFRKYGEYLPVDSLGGVDGFRSLIDELRNDGIRTGLYCHPYHADTSIPEIAKHPDWLVSGQTPSAPQTSGDMQLGSLDWTHPETPQYMRSIVRRLVSSEPDCLNADWLMVNNNHAPDPLKTRFHDRGWGIGDRMAYKARKAIYEFAKEFKSDVMVSFIGLDPILQETADLFWVNESWGETCDNWHQMASAVARCQPGTLLAVNPYILSHGKHAEFVSVMPAYSVPSAMPLNHIHAHGHSTQWQEMTRENHRRWIASWQVYMNAPMTADQLRHIDLSGDRLIAWRKYPSGPLAGFYAGLALGRRGMVTYNTTEARAMAFDYLVAEIPLPPNIELKSVEAVASDGSTMHVPYTVEDRTDHRYAILEMWDSGSGQTGRDDVLYYRLSY